MDLDISQFRNRTMRKVYGVWLIRHVLPLIMFEAAFLAFMLSLTKVYMSLGVVMERAMDRALNYPLGNFFAYLASAFEQTEMLGILMLAGFTCAVFFFTRDVARFSVRLAGNLMRRPSVT